MRAPSRCVVRREHHDGRDRHHRGRGDEHAVRQRTTRFALKSGQEPEHEERARIRAPDRAYEQDGRADDGGEGERRK